MKKTLLFFAAAFLLLPACEKLNRERDLNRPFAYFIRETSSNTLLLAGTLLN